MPPPIGPEVDTTPRPLPARVPIRGQHVVLEPLSRLHAAELWEAAQGADDSWAYLGCGPFASLEAMARYVADFAVEQDRMVWAIRPIATGAASGTVPGHIGTCVCPGDGCHTDFCALRPPHANTIQRAKIKGFVTISTA